MFIPAFKTACVANKQTGSSLTGESVYVASKTNIGWSPIYMRNDDAKTAVRADSSASKSRADVNAGEFRIIMMNNAGHLAIGDIVLLPESQTYNKGFTFKITRLLPRHDVFGRLHHFEIDLAKATDAVVGVESNKANGVSVSFRLLGG